MNIKSTLFLLIGTILGPDLGEGKPDSKIVMRRPDVYTLAMSIEPGEFAVLRVADLNRIGAFLESGQQKDLFLPFAEQTKTLQVGLSALQCGLSATSTQQCRS
jgi:hypothetical protein